MHDQAGGFHQIQCLGLNLCRLFAIFLEDGCICVIMEGMQIALYGGSFDPPHVAHQMACLYVLSTYNIDEVWMMPCFDHPFGKQSVAFVHRKEMCLRAARLLSPHVQVSDIEAELGGKSYTLRTVKALMKQFPQHQFHVVIGEDVVSSQDKWYGFEELNTLVSFIVLGRQGFCAGSAPRFRLPEISSTQIRESLSRGLRPTDVLSRGVLEYIDAHQQYQPDDGSEVCP